MGLSGVDLIKENHIPFVISLGEKSLLRKPFDNASMNELLARHHAVQQERKDEMKHHAVLYERKEEFMRSCQLVFLFPSAAEGHQGHRAS